MSDGVGQAFRPNWADRLKLRLSAVLWFVLGAGFLLSLPVLLDISLWTVLGIALVALVLCVPAAWLIRSIFRGQRAQSWWSSLLKAFFALLFAVCIIAAAPLYYFALLTGLRPMTVPQATLSDGNKTVVFQGMSHIGTEGFYKSVVYDLEKALADGYVIYYEGVMGSPDGDAWFSKTLAGGGDLSANYKLISDVCGLKFQLDYFGLLQADMAARPDRHVNADVTTADMMHEYERLLQSDPDFAAARATASADDAAPNTGPAQLLAWLQAGTPEQRKLAGYACRGFLTMQLGGKAAPDQMDKVILDYRNRALADRIAADSHQLIYITYGAGHLPGLFDLLKAKDPAWEMQSLKWMRTIATPEELDGKL